MESGLTGRVLAIQENLEFCVNVVVAIKIPVLEMESVAQRDTVFATMDFREHHAPILKSVQSALLLKNHAMEKFLDNAQVPENALVET
jgi:hypothetical protein